MADRDPGANLLANDYTRSLLASLPESARRVPDTGPQPPADHESGPAVFEWADSGCMWLSGEPGQSPSPHPSSLATCARATLQAIEARAGRPLPAQLAGAGLLAERAAISGWNRNGQTSAGGSCRLLKSADGWLAVNLPRSEDLRLLEAWLGPELAVGDHGPAPWPTLASALALRKSKPSVERARLLGLAVAEVASHGGGRRPDWHQVAAEGPAAAPPVPGRLPLVVDFSSLWAGPLSSRLLAALGATIIKIESLGRPDGARKGPAPFYDLLNGGKQSVALDFSCDEDRAWLARLVAAADIVIEASRPRALAQLGLDAEAWVKARPGRVWLSLSGYGRSEPEANWIAFGDDAACAAGLAWAGGRDLGYPVFCADAVADPLAGIHAALAALAYWQSGAGVLLDIALSRVAAHVLSFGQGYEQACEVQKTSAGHWLVLTEADARQVAEPKAPNMAAAAARLGADTARVLAGLDQASGL
ncbi:MAG: CoA transferase [Deltaproteobacteria bacterium]